MKLIMENWRKLLKEEIEPVGDVRARMADAHGRPMGVYNSGLSPEVKKGTELFWYETADGEHVPVEDPRFAGPDTKKVSGVVVRIDPGSPSEDVDSTNLAGWFPGPYVLIKVPGGTMEVNREWWDSIFIK